MVIHLGKISIIHLSDLHIGKCCPSRAELTRRLFNKIKDAHPGELVLITGDITNSGTKCQCKKARELLKILSKKNKVLMVPGNHDYRFLGIGVLWERFRPRKLLPGYESPDRNWYEILGRPLGWKKTQDIWLSEKSKPKGIDGLGIREFEKFVVIGIDSGDLDGGCATAKGLVSYKLCCGLKKLLEHWKEKKKLRIVILHHYPFNYGMQKRGIWNTIVRNRMVLKDPIHLLNTINNNCELLLFGHKHEYKFWSKNSLYAPYIVASNSSTEKDRKDYQYRYVRIAITKAGTKKYEIDANRIVY
jgi:3',5'-cyclic AMP phosphodiesterase CpdA